MKLRFPQFAMALAMVALFVGGQALAEDVTHHSHYTIKVVPKAGNSNVVRPATLANGLYGVAQWFGTSPYTAASTVTNSDGSELWPCFGGTTVTNSTGGTASYNPDCRYVGDPQQVLPAGAIVIGAPNYTWPLASDSSTGVVGCDQSTSSDTTPCGQTVTWYEDDSNDTVATDELLYIIEATQGSSVIADSGTVDFGPNPYAGLSPAADIIIYGDQGFGTEGVTGENNGNCEADLNYPLATGANPGTLYIVQANKTCVNPVAGPVSITATTEIASPAYTLSKSSSVCAAGGLTEPCYTVKYTVKFKATQKWTINLE